MSQSLPSVFVKINQMENASSSVMSRQPERIPYGAPPNVSNNSVTKPEETLLPNVSFQDRKSNAEAMLISFVAEHGLPLSITPHLLNLSKELGRDTKTLESLKMERQSATYKLKDGLDAVIHKRLVNELRSIPFSMNIDECTTKGNNEKVLSILVSYYSNEQKECVVRHYASVSMTTVNARTVYATVVDLFKKDNIPLDNLISSLSDSANYMRGKISGFETLLRKSAPHLLDVDGDVCHHVHNITKKFCSYFGHKLESLADDLHTDCKYSSDIKSYFEEICLLLGVRYRVPPQRVAHRWLSMFDVTLTNKELLEPLIVLYFAWIDSNIKEAYKCMYSDITKHLSKESKRRLQEIAGALKNKNLTKEGRERKKRIVDKLIYKRSLTLLDMSIYLSVLPLFKSFILIFESKEPLVHRLHEEMLSLVRHFFCCFVKHEFVKDLAAHKLLTLDVTSKKHLMPLSMLYVGRQAEVLLVELDSSEVLHILETVKNAYIGAAEYLQTKFPLNNKLLRYLTALNPNRQGNSDSYGSLKKLVKYFPTVLREEDHDEYLLEISKLQLDPTLPDPVEYPRLDAWWTVVFPSYPVLQKVVKAALSVFTGPRVEQSFSIMNDIINPKSNRMHISTFSAIQSVKYDLKARNTTSLKLYHREDKLKSPVDTAVCYHMQTAYGRLNMKRKTEQEENASLSKKMKIQPTKQTPMRNVHTLAAAHRKRILKNVLAKKRKKNRN